jgi:hypothetical protein
VNVKSANAATMENVLAYWFGFDVYRLATPERNPDGSSYWTEAYLDTAGAGLMVSHAAPVYQQGRYVGMVGTDVLLGFLTELLQAFTERWGQVWIVNETGQVLADPDHPYTAADQRVRTLADVLPESLRSVPVDSCCNPPTSFGASPTSTFTRSVSSRRPGICCTPSRPPRSPLACCRACIPP